MKSPAGIKNAKKAQVAIVQGFDYAKASEYVGQMFDLLGGIEKFCARGDTVMVKPNMCVPLPPEKAETTHPAIVAAVVRALKETGAKVKVGEQASWGASAEQAFDISGIRAGALEAGADEVVNWENDEYLEVEIPNPRSIARARLPRSVLEADRLIHIPKMKNNSMQLVTLGIKGWLGLLAYQDRYLYHRTDADIAFATCDLAKAIKDKHCLTLIDGITGLMGGGTHAGKVCNPGLLIGSADMVAATAVCCAAMGYHPLEAPATQVAMKDGIGTGELNEIDILGARLEDVVFNFQRPLPRIVSPFSNVKEFTGGACPNCLRCYSGLPPVVDPAKRYALIAGARALVAEDLSGYDEVWLIGKCASSESHQYGGFSDKLKAAKKVVKIDGCPAGGALHSYYKDPHESGTVYDFPHLAQADNVVLSMLPDVCDEEAAKEAAKRRRGEVSLEQFKKSSAWYLKWWEA